MDAACEDNKGILYTVYDSQISRAVSIMLLPWTLPVEFSLSFTKRYFKFVNDFYRQSTSFCFFEILIIFKNAFRKRFSSLYNEFLIKIFFMQMYGVNFFQVSHVLVL